jgi:hypothetical protein
MQSDYHNLPRINGQSQCEGKQYAARVVKYQPGQLTLDLKEAYPREAQIRWWKRIVKVQIKRRVEVTEDFCLDAYVAPTQLILMTPVKPELGKGGTLLLGNHSLIYDDKLLEPTIEDVSPMLDPTLRQMWGQQMYRIVLTVKNKVLKTKLKYYIQ